MNQTQNRFPSISVWIMAARPRTLPAAAAPVFVALAFAYHDGILYWPAAVCCLLISLLMQIGANFANDLFDAERGTDTPDRLGPTRVTATGMLTPRMMKIGVIVVFGVAACFGIYLTWLRGYLVMVLGVLILLAALAYTGGPFPYGYYALGDVFVLLSFGFAAVCGTYFVQAGTLSISSIWASVPVGLLIVNVLVVNNTRDIGTDRFAHKRTLAVFLGRKAMIIEYLLCLLIAYFVPLWMWLSGISSLGGLLTWISIPLGYKIFQEFMKNDGRALNQTLAGTARLALIFSILFAFGILLFP